MYVYVRKNACMRACVRACLRVCLYVFNAGRLAQFVLFLVKRKICLAQKTDEQTVMEKLNFRHT